MSAANDSKGERPMAEPDTQRSGNEVGGMRAGSEHGFADATQRSMEHADTSPLGRASTGDAAGGASEPRLDLGGTDAPGASGGPTGPVDTPAADDRAAQPRSDRVTSADAAAGRSTDSDEDEDEWRHEPVEPVDERNPVKSLGRAVADTLTGGAEDTSKPPER